MAFVKNNLFLAQRKGETVENVFEISTKKNRTVTLLREAIKDKNKNYLKDIDARKLKIWKVEIPAEHENNKLELLSSKSYDQINVQEDLGGELLQSFDVLEEHFKSKITTNQISIIIQLPAPEKKRKTTEEAPEKKRKTTEEVQDISGRILDDLRKKSKMILPEVNFLEEHIDRELPEDIKIPLTQREFNSLLSNDFEDPCTPDDLRILFRISETESALKLCSGILFKPIVSKAPPSHGTVNSFINFWDNNIRGPLELLILNSSSVRNSSKNISINQDRPNYGLIVNQVCPFRGEEKSLSNDEDPKYELGNKLVWTYDPAPYVLGYYATGTLLSYVAICRPPKGHGMPDVVNIASCLNLSLKRSRVRNLLRIINLSKIIEKIQEVIGIRDTAEFIPINREDKIIELYGKSIKKIYLCNNAPVRVESLINIYERLKQKGVPNVDQIDHADINKGEVYFSPKGMSVKPKNSKELLEAIVCILEALVISHCSDNGGPLYHRDIRWSNIIRIPASSGPSKWIIIDWEDAAGYPNEPAIRLTRIYHAPEVFKKNHRGEVDIWSVGNLIIDAWRWIHDLSTDIINIGRRMMSNRPSAGEALKMIEQIQNSIS